MKASLQTDTKNYNELVEDTVFSFRSKSTAYDSHRPQSRNIPDSKPILIAPALTAGMGLGIYLYLNSTISELGASAFYIYAIACFTCAVAYQVVHALFNKHHHGRYWMIEKSNLFKYDANYDVILNWKNIYGLLMRTSLHLCHNISIIWAFQYANQASLNTGLITCL